MPWKECHVMDERLRFLVRLLWIRPPCQSMHHPDRTSVGRLKKESGRHRAADRVQVDGAVLLQRSQSSWRSTRLGDPHLRTAAHVERIGCGVQLLKTDRVRSHWFG